MGIAVSVENGLQRRAGYWTIIPPTPGHIAQNCLEPHTHRVHNADPLSPETIQAIAEAIRIAVGGDAMRGGPLATSSPREARQRSHRIFRPTTSKRCAPVA